FAAWVAHSDVPVDPLTDCLRSVPLHTNASGNQTHPAVMIFPNQLLPDTPERHDTARLAERLTFTQFRAISFRDARISPVSNERCPTSVLDRLVGGQITKQRRATGITRLSRNVRQA